MSDKPADFKFENYQEYFGDVKEVKKLMNKCKKCNANLIKTHLSDFSNLYVQENSRCPDCGEDNRKIIHILN